MIDAVMIFIATVISIAALLAAARVLFGPSNADRIVAMELLTGLIIALLAIAAWQQWGMHALDVAIGLGLVGFLGSVGLAAALAPNRGGIFHVSSSQDDKAGQS